MMTIAFKRSLPYVLGAVIMAVPPVLHQAMADAASEIVTAQSHAGLAAAAGKIEGVHTHLHHALNCLVGPAGEGFDIKELDPCAHAGTGAIPDTNDAGKRKKLEEAAQRARDGIAANDMATARKAAEETAAMLKALE